MMKITISHDRAVSEAGFYRAKDSEATLEAAGRAAKLLNPEGLADKTALDRAKIPCFLFVRKNTAIGGFGLHYGAGFDTGRARISALLRAIEHHSAEYRGDPMDIMSFEDIGFLRGIMPDDLILSRKLKEKEEVQWSPALDIMNQKEMLVPSNAVFYPYDCLGMVAPLFRSIPVGIAAGNSHAEAILYGLYDVILVDTLSHAETWRDHGRKISVEENGAARDMIDRLDEAGIAVNLWLLNSRTGLPCVVAAADDDLSKKPGFIVSGFGSHQDPEIAVISALNEVVVRRMDYIENGQYNTVRESVLEKTGYDRLKRINRLWYGEGEKISLGEINSSVSGYLDDDVDTMITMLDGHADHILVADLTRTEIPVVRVIVPGFQVSHLDPRRTANTGTDSGAPMDDGLFSMDTGGRDFKTGL